jgi:long-subunit acyl-CoA synthetase (AMP-forming)
MLDSAALHLGATPFSVYATSAPEQVAFQLRDGGARIVACDEASVDVVRASGVVLDHLIVLSDGTAVLDELAAASDLSDAAFESSWRAVDANDVATIVYTSGTTGDPKGVQLTHATALGCARAVDERISFPDETCVLSYLPLAHVAERNNSHWFAMCFGFTVTTCPDPRRVADVLPDVQPTWFFGVPRVFEKLKASILASADAQLAEVIERARTTDSAAAREPQLEDADALRALRERIGFGRAVAVNVGAAPAVPEMVEFFHAIGVPLAELWGMTEINGAGTINPSRHIKIGSVGPPVDGLEVRTAGDGELEVRSAMLAAGYRNRPDLTAQAMSPDGWFRTGDLASIDDDGYVWIVGRKKEIMVNAAGKNMSPTNIESNIKSESFLIGQVMAIGDQRPYNVALIVLDPEVARIRASELDLQGPRLLSKLVEDPRVVAECSAAVERGNAKMSRVEQIKRFRLLDVEWQPGGEELTPTMKLKRKTIEARYSDTVEQLYASS